jgi:hypothetical protein
MNDHLVLVDLDNVSFGCNHYLGLLLTSSFLLFKWKLDMISSLYHELGVCSYQFVISCHLLLLS